MSSVTDKDLERFEKIKAIDYLSSRKALFYAILVKTIIEVRVNEAKADKILKKIGRSTQ